VQGTTYTGRSIEASKPAAIPASSSERLTIRLVFTGMLGKAEEILADVRQWGAPYLYAFARQPGPSTKQLLRLVARTARATAGDIRELCVPTLRGATYDAGLRQLWLKGLVLLGVFTGTIGLWVLVAPLSNAVVGSGQFVVESYGKKIQHPTGGIISEIRVREGDRVAEGDVLVRLDETITNANLQVIAKQLDEFAVRRARLEAERDGHSSFELPGEAAGRQSEPSFAQLFRAEQSYFAMRKAAGDSQRAQLRKRIVQLQEEVRGLRAQEGAKGREAEIISKELEGVRELYRKNLIQVTRLNTLEREAASLEGQRGQLIASIAQAEGKIAEIELQLLQLDQDLRTETQKEIGEIRAKVAELTERRTAAEDQVRRVEIRAPTAGYVHQLATHTVGGVISPAEPLMSIVPAGDKLILEANVAPHDRDQLHPGQLAQVRILAFNQRTTPELSGEVTQISADVVKDQQTGQTFYKVRIAIPAGEFARLDSAEVVAGMQAEVFIHIASRTPLEYLLKPLSDQIARAFRER
jgi:HlyD family secretion protein